MTNEETEERANRAWVIRALRELRAGRSRELTASEIGALIELLEGECKIADVEALTTEIRKLTGEIAKLRAKLIRYENEMPECVEPGCTERVMSWRADGEYVPVDSGLCETHHRAENE